MDKIFGIAVLALIPGFIARRKGRSFWGYYFLSFLVSPLISTIVTLCVRNTNKPVGKKPNPSNDPPKGLNKLFSSSPENTITPSNASANNDTSPDTALPLPAALTPENDSGNEENVVRPNPDPIVEEVATASRDISQDSETALGVPVSRFCRKCGFQLLNDSDYCSHCGTKVVTVPQEPRTAESLADSTIGAKTETEVHVVRGQEFWEQLQQLCVAAQEQIKEDTLPLLSDAGLLSASGKTVQIDINDMKRPLLVMAELWVFPIAVFVAALNDYLSSMTEEDEDNIRQYLYSCGDEVLQSLQQIAKDEAKILYNRMNDYNTACKNEMVCGFSGYGQGKLLFHDFEEFELCAEDKNHEVKCALLFGDFLYYYSYYGSLPTLSDISKLKTVVAKNSAKNAIKYENLYRSIHPLVSALYGEVKSLIGV